MSQLSVMLVREFDNEFYEFIEDTFRLVGNSSTWRLAHTNKVGHSKSFADIIK